ncbi:FAD-dependent oxidoreductase [Saccharopolyspora taberi]|uniref:FAD-dependent oxidoreductase n=1 Tax=Saccharopolyspora taberi TaxID=60895 RepID=UPI0031D87A8B
MPQLSRRSLIKSASGLGAAGLFAGAAPADAVPVGRRRVAVLGAGAGGIATAYFLSGDCDVTLFESRSKVGGHCDSVTMEYKGNPLTVDLGAQFFHPGTHPIYVTLLEELGLYDPDAPDGDDTIEAPGSVCVYSGDGGLPRFSSTYPLLTPVKAVDFAIYSQKAREAVLDGISWDVRTEDWIADLPVSDRFKTDVLYPWIVSLFGSTRADAARASVRSVLQLYALAFPPTLELLKGASTWNSSIGLEGNLRRMLDRSPGARVLVNSPVRGLSYSGGQWTVRTPAGTSGPFDAVVVNAPPHTSKSFFGDVPWAADIVGLLGEHEYFDVRIALHTDPRYVHDDRAMWAVDNAEVAGAESEGSIWLGGIHPKLPDGGTVDVFKSWALRRAEEPDDVLFERKFRHPLITPEVVRATRSLNTLQGRNGLYFSGGYTAGFDLQETAVYSAMKVADALAPSSATLASLRRRLALRDRSGISYDL